MKQLYTDQISKTVNGSTTTKVSIIDDDPIAAAVMRARLSKRFPNSEIEISKTPTITPDRNIYLVDNDFNGESLAGVLLRQIRSLNPNALVVAMSSTLDQTELETLMNGGCNAVYNKGRPSDANIIFEVIENYINVLNKQEREAKGASLGGIIHSLKDLLEQWNQRLSHEIS